MNLNIFKKSYRKLLPGYEYQLDQQIGNCQTVLDVGCGYPSPIKNFSGRFWSVGVDLFLPSLQKSGADHIHNEYLLGNILDIDKFFQPDSFDCVLASDVIEHLPKEQGLQLMQKMEAIAKRKVIIFTPNGFLPQSSYDGNKWQEHKSGWEVKEMQKHGYEIIGISGWKSLRGEYATVKFRPKFIWQIFSDLTQLYTKSHPNKAFQLLCIKHKNILS